MDIALLILRLVVGLAFVAHGSQKLFGWFGGYGLAGTGGFFESLGFRPGKLFAGAAGASEFLGGLLIAIGVGGPIGPALIVATMVTAALSVHVKNGFFAPNGIELNLVYAAASVALALVGFGAYAVDAALGVSALWTPAIAWALLAVGVLAGLANLAARRKAPQAATQA